MTLLDFMQDLDAEGRRDLARRTGTTYNYLHQLACGARKPSVDLCRKLEAASGRRLTREILRPDLYR